MIRLNKFLAHATGMSRREADDAIAGGRVLVDGNVVSLGAQIDDGAKITLDGRAISTAISHRTIMLNKPVGYVCSRRAQGNDKTIYDILPNEFRSLKPVGRLDRDSSGLLLMTTDGDLAFRMTHPSFRKNKTYTVQLNRPLEPLHQQMISDIGVDLPDGKSQLLLEKLDDSRQNWRINMHEGRNRQIRRTFSALGYNVQKLHRTEFGNYALDDMSPGEWREISA